MKRFGTLVMKEQRVEMMSCGSMVELIDWLDGVREAVRKSGCRLAFMWDGSRGMPKSIKKSVSGRRSRFAKVRVPHENVQSLTAVVGSEQAVAGQKLWWFAAQPEILTAWFQHSLGK